MTPLFTAIRGLHPEPGPARDLVRAELAKHEYQPSLLERIVRWFGDLLQRLGNAANGIGRLSPAVAVVLLGLVLVGLAVVLARLRRDPTPRTRPGPVFTENRVSSSEYRGRSELARAAGRYDEAVIEAMRAIAVGLVERAILDDLPAATAREVADQAASGFVELAPRLHAAADRFDAVRYGDRHADAAAAEELLALESAVRKARPHPTATTGPVLAVPR